MPKLTFKTPLSENENANLRSEFAGFLATKLREVRKSKNMTQQELAEKAGLHLTYVGHLENGKYHPSVFVIWKIANALKVEFNRLLED